MVGIGHAAPRLTMFRCKADLALGTEPEPNVWAGLNATRRRALGATSDLFHLREHDLDSRFNSLGASLRQSGSGHSINNQFRNPAATPAERKCSAGYFLNRKDRPLVKLNLCFIAWATFVRHSAYHRAVLGYLSVAHLTGMDGDEKTLAVERLRYLRGPDRSYKRRTARKR